MMAGEFDLPMSALPDAGRLCSAEQLDAVRMLFAFELCENCGGDYTDHKVVEGPFGLPFAACLRELEELHREVHGREGSAT